MRPLSKRWGIIPCGINCKCGMNCKAEGRVFYKLAITIEATYSSPANIRPTSA